MELLRHVKVDFTEEKPYNTVPNRHRALKIKKKIPRPRQGGGHHGGVLNQF
jgi:hypothetical protein